MQPKVINPYQIFGVKHKEALDTIGGNLPANPTYEQVNEVFVTSLYSSQSTIPLADTIAQLYLFPLLPNVYNGYVNGALIKNINYTDNQQAIINKLLNGLKVVDPASIPVMIDSIEEQIAASALHLEEQAPLFIAAQIARSDFDYWTNQIDNPGIWQNFLDTDKAINVMHVPSYVSAAVQGALLAYGTSKHPQIDLLDFLLAYGGSVGLVTGKVVLGWVGKEN